MKAAAALVLLASLSAGQQFLPVQSPAVRLAAAGTTFIGGDDPTFGSNLQRGISQAEQQQRFFQEKQNQRIFQDQARFQSGLGNQFQTDAFQKVVPQDNNGIQVISEQERLGNFRNQPSRDNAFQIQQERDIAFAAQQNRDNAFRAGRNSNSAFQSQTDAAFQAQDNAAFQAQQIRDSAFQSQDNAVFQNIERQNRNNVAFQQPQFRSGANFNFDESSESGVFEPLNLPSGASALLGAISSSFSCADRPYGYYADPDNFCRVFHICNPALFADGAVEIYQYSFFCGEGSVFDQAKLTCVAEFEATPCQDAPSFYFRNEVFGRDVEA